MNIFHDFAGSVPLASVASFNPDFPGIVFSKKCVEKRVDHRGATVVGEGIKLRVPENAVQSGDSVNIELQSCIEGPFVLPHDTVLVSPVYRIAPSFVFHEKVMLTIEHFAVLESDEDCDEVVFITSPKKPKIREKTDKVDWKFEVYAKSECAVRSQHGDVCLKHFCLGALGRRLRRGKQTDLLILLSVVITTSFNLQVKSIAIVQPCTHHKCMFHHSVMLSSVLPYIIEST